LPWALSGRPKTRELSTDELSDQACFPSEITACSLLIAVMAIMDEKQIVYPALVWRIGRRNLDR
jgi:hypothetical protein